MIQILVAIFFSSDMNEQYLYEDPYAVPQTARHNVKQKPVVTEPAQVQPKSKCLAVHE